MSKMGSNKSVPSLLRAEHLMNEVRTYSLKNLEIQGEMRWDDLIVVKYLMGITVHYSFMFIHA